MMKEQAKDLHMRISISFIIGIVLLQLFSCSNKERDQIDNLTDFAKIYGLVKYYHPSDEATELDWKSFSAYGAKKVFACTTDQELVDSLYSIFMDVAPSVQFSVNEIESDLSEYIPEDVENKRITYWQHNGINIDVNNLSDRYKSVRVNRQLQDSAIFEKKIEFGESITTKLGQIYCHIPIALYCDDENTYPIGNTKIEYKKWQYEGSEQLEVRLANVINYYNIIEHFYPYLDLVDVNWESELEKAIKRSFTDSTAIDHLMTLEKMTSPLDDGHIFTHSYKAQIFNLPPISTEIVEGKLIVTKEIEGNSQVAPGDVITHIDGQDFESLYKEVCSRISAGTIGYKNYRAQTKILEGKYDSEVKVSINNSDHIFKRTVSPYENKEPELTSSSKYYGDTILYIDLRVMAIDSFKMRVQEISKVENLILDLRGYPNQNWQLLEYFITADTPTKWMQIPQKTFPNKTDSFQKISWGLEAKRPYLGDKNIIVLTNGKAISQAESILAYFKHNHVATIVGQASAGTNGEIIPFILLGEFTTMFTGMKVIKHDGSQLHGIGILPDVYVNKSIEGVKNGKDEYLEKALQILKEIR